MPRARFVHGWAWPKTPNSVHNLGLLGTYRNPLQMPEDGEFNPEDSCILGEGWTNEENGNICIETNTPMIMNILIHGSGNYRGQGYHQRRPYTDETKIYEYTLSALRYYEDLGVQIDDVAFGNELTYAPSEHSNWTAYLSRLISCGEACLDAIPFNRIIMGCNHGRSYDPNSGRKELPQYILERGKKGVFDVDIHGNRKGVNRLKEEIRWCIDRGLRTHVLEDQAPGSNNDAEYRCKIISMEGALSAGQFGSRNVNAAGNNPNCRWGSSNQKVDTGAGWTCAGYLKEEFFRLVHYSDWSNSLRDGTLLPDDTDGPVIPPNNDEDYLRAAADLFRKSLQLSEYPSASLPLIDELVDDPQWAAKARRLKNEINSG